MNLSQIQSALDAQRKSFNETVLLPNTLQRNIDLAGYRNEIARLERLMTKTPATVKKPAPRAKSPKQSVAEAHPETGV